MFDLGALLHLRIDLVPPVLESITGKGISLEGFEESQNVLGVSSQ